MHHCEPTLDTLKTIQKQLYGAKSTDANMKKLKAVEAQIARREKEEKENKKNV